MDYDSTLSKLAHDGPRTGLQILLAVGLFAIATGIQFYFSQYYTLTLGQLFLPMLLVVCMASVLGGTACGAIVTGEVIVSEAIQLGALSDSEGILRTAFFAATATAIIGLAHAARDANRRVLASEMLRSVDQRFQLLVDQAPVAIAMFDTDMRYLAVSDKWVNDYGLDRNSIIGRCQYDVIPRIPEHWKIAHRRGMAGEVMRGTSDPFIAPNGNTYYTDWEVHPWLTAKRSIGGIIIMAVNVTEKVRAQRALAASEERLRLALEAGQMAIWDWTPETGHVLWNDQHYTILGYVPGSITPSYDAWAKRVLPADLPDLEIKLKHCLETGAPYQAQFRVLAKHDQVRWIEAQGNVRKAAHDQPTRMYGVMHDITERKRVEERNSTLLAEVNHRAKNILTIVQAIAEQTSRNVPDRDFVRLFSDRLRSLAMSQELLVKSQWGGVDLGNLLNSQFSPYLGLLESRLSHSGDAFVLNSAAAQSIGMALHELATNAVKHGALSGPTGSVSIDWGVTHEDFWLRWIEDFPLNEAPTHRGFGYVVMVEYLQHTLGGTASISYPRAGLRWEFRAPLAKVQHIDQMPREPI